MFDDLQLYAEKMRAKNAGGRKSKNDLRRQMIYRGFQADFNI